MIITDRDYVLTSYRSEKGLLGLPILKSIKIQDCTKEV